ncbi:AAA family ATPase [Lewinella cohaerens]|uniref:AAA family ATPase n=1 Tax=Lewinella cohaerens TaxID=70995 RepID=UPI000377A407|nr:AAA family ATPase [Lewinella cohaerens]
MKLKELHINGYKNLKDKTVFNFENCTNYVALIGLNGSGKSNVLEALSRIIHTHYYKKEPITDFTYKMVYELDDKEVKLENNKVYVNNRERKNNIKDFLPPQIIACYSGEETRLWEDVFQKPYLKYFNRIKLNYQAQKLRFLYINKYNWSSALLTLLCRADSQYFVKELLGINDLQADIKIKFVFSDNYEDRKDKFSLGNTTAFTIPQLTDRLKTEQERNPGTTAKTSALDSSEQVLPETERTLKDEEDQYLSLTEITGIDLGNIEHQNENDKWCRQFFEYLFLATMPKTKKLISDIKIEFNDKDVRKLSEGEKKLILITCISKLLAIDNSIVLFDEPDVSLHISRKAEIKDVIESNNHYTILTTHSPKLIKELKEENVFIVKDESGNVEVIDTNTIKNIEHITNNEFSLTDATLMFSLNKDVLLVEGTNDYNYINEAIKKLAPIYDNFNFHIINCGGADNVPVVLEQSLKNLLKPSQKCVCLFDFDGQGKRNFIKIQEIVNETGNNNIIPMYHPLPDGKEHTEGNDFLMEQYFPINCYKPLILERINQKVNFNQLSEYQKPKSIIQKRYKDFEPLYYSNFATLINNLINIQT